jgi:hypothetical protein
LFNGDFRHGELPVLTTVAAIHRALGTIRVSAASLFVVLQRHSAALTGLIDISTHVAAYSPCGFCSDRLGRDDVIRIDEICQSVGTEHDYHKIAKRDELRMSHTERTAIGQIELKRSEAVAREFSQLLDVHNLILNKMICASI